MRLSLPPNRRLAGSSPRHYWQCPAPRRTFSAARWCTQNWRARRCSASAMPRCRACARRPRPTRYFWRGACALGMPRFGASARLAQLDRPAIGTASGGTHMYCDRRSDRAGNHAAHRKPRPVSEYGGLRHARARTAWRDHSFRVGQIPLESKARIALIDTVSHRAQRRPFYDAPKRGTVDTLWVKSGHCRQTFECPLCAKSGLMHRSNWTVGASEQFDAISRPNGPAVVRLMTR
jgi:hypothetical protein